MDFSKIDYAWLGDSVLGLFMRMLLLHNSIPQGKTRGDLFTQITSNQFLSGFGNPTEVEAHIGRIFNEQGILGAFQYIETEIYPVLRRQLKNRGFDMPINPCLRKETQSLSNDSPNFG
jgi:hypothetical protein